jgi:hypothetical protein
MKQKKPFNLPVNEPTCYVTPEIMRQFDDGLDEEYWINLKALAGRMHKPRKREHE